MSDTSQIAIQALRGRASALLDERRALRRQLLNGVRRDLEIEVDLQGCVAGARALGGEIQPLDGFPNPLAQKEHPLHSFHMQYIQGRNMMANAARHLIDGYGLNDAQDAPASEVDTEENDGMPRIAEIVLSRLKDAGEKGSKAAPIEAYVKDTYGRTLHEKTIGMTLYRLQREGKVRREGHTWFLASTEAGKSGATTPDPEKFI